MNPNGNLGNWSKALTAILIGSFLTTLSATGHAMTPGASGCELTGVNGPSSPGSSSNPYEISTAMELAEIEDCDSSTSRHFQLVNDIDLQGIAWKPIAAASTPTGSLASNQFSGHLDGAGFKITNLSTSDAYVGGLFGVIRGNDAADRSSVKNLTVQGRVTGGVFGLEARFASFSNIVLNVDVTRNPNGSTSGTGVALGAIAASGLIIDAVSISVVASGEFGINGIVGDSLASNLGGLVGSSGTFNSNPTPNLFSEIKIRTYIGSARPSATLGGLVADAGHLNHVHSSRVQVTLHSFQAATGHNAPNMGGIAASVRSTARLTVSNSVVEALLILPNSSTTRDFSAGGMIGVGLAAIQSSTVILHAHLPKDGSMGTNSRIGGFFGAAISSSTLVESYASLTITSETVVEARPVRGALIGQIGSGATVNGSSNFFNGSSSPLVVGAVGDSSAAGSFTLNANSLSIDQIVPSTFASAGWDIAASSVSFDATTAWNICEHPSPTAAGSDNCGPLFLGGKVSRTGLGVELFFGSHIQVNSLPPQSSLEIRADSSLVSLDPPRASSFNVSNSFAVSFSNDAEFDSSVVVLGSYSKPQTGPVIASLTGRAVASFPLTKFANSSLLLPPTGAISLISSGTTTASLQVQCTSDCGGGTSFTYSIEVERLGSGTVEVVVSDSGHITGLQPSTSYTAKATVTFNGRTSAEVSLSFNTQRPEATISAVTLNGQEVTGVISCVNCGVDPTTISLMATPIAGGATINSSASVLTSLALATSYSISARVTFMGAESLEVTWSSPILTSADPMPAITSIDPASVLTSGGTEVTIIGTNFTGASISVNGVVISPVTIVSTNELKFTSLPGSAANSIVRVTNAGGFAEAPLLYTAPPAPQTPATAGSAPSVAITTPMIVEFSTREITVSGAQVTATGQSLEGISVLTLGGIAVTIVSNTATSITFITGEMPLGVWDLRLVGANGTLVFQNAIEVVGVTIVTQSTGELLGYTWTLRFLGNSRSLHSAQEAHLQRRMSANSKAETIICWGYTSASSPNAWAIAHATQRAQAACDLALVDNPAVKTAIRLRFGVEKSWAMRSAVQFWR